MSLWWRLVRFGFWLLYNPLAFTYDWVSSLVSFGAWKSWGAAALGYVNADGVILELAHGTGHLQLEMTARGWRTVGFDLSQSMGQITRRRLLQQGRAALLVRGMAQRLPFAAGSFSSVVSTFPTDFITAEESLAEISRVLMLDGNLVIVPTAIFTGGGAARRVLEFAYRITGQRVDEPSSEMENYIRDHWHGLFERHGFSLRIARVPCKRSEAIVLIAGKQV
ncbi:class I SAM-dependent methyltransferase [Geitlerinema splendidum]|jgi:ubiquinone/menaquinone biosynthesis C-methylase UbiE|nr:class I SAM-dependent methyltransferase [Geitlerinema splendidum]